MKTLFDWLKRNWQFVTTIAAIVSAFGFVKLTVTTGPADQPPEVIVVIPTDDGAPEPLVVQGGFADGDRRPVLFAFARLAAAGKYHRQHPELTYRQCLALAQQVSDKDVDQAAKTAGVSFEGMPVGGPLQNLLEWIKNNPETVQKIIQILIMLIPLFA